MTGEKQSQRTGELVVLAPLWEELQRALGWVAVQGLVFVQPLLRGWGEGVDEALERALRWLEGDAPAEGKR